MTTTEKFYVMKCIDGDEHLVAVFDDIHAAFNTIRDDKSARDLSIMSTTRGILVLRSERE